MDQVKKIYIVGGFVRDRIMGIESHDHDFVCVGYAHADMISLGFKHVDASSFPVYHHPITGDEYALARRELKVGPGYHGFDVDASPGVTLYEDLYRRDLTINSLAREVIGWNELGHAKLSDEVVDPFGGVADINNKLLRPVSEHFKDDPVRVLRAGRFAARFPDFMWSPELIISCNDLFNNGELDHLVPERVFLELEKTMTERSPGRFFELIQCVGNSMNNRATSHLFPGSNLFVSTELSKVIEEMFSIEDVETRKNARFAMLTSELTAPSCEAFLDVIKAPTHVRRMCLNTIGVIGECIDNKRVPLTGALLMDMIDGLSCLRAGQHDIPVMVEVMSRMRNGMAKQVAALLPQAVTEIKTIGLKEAGGIPITLSMAPLNGPAIAAKIREIRVERLQQLIEQTQ